MAYAILRAKKLKTAGSVAAALQHNFRERTTPNADPERTAANEHHAASSTAEAMGLLRERLPAKHRKDAVLAVEYVMTASPTWFDQAGPDVQRVFFDRCLAWLRDKYGADNVIAATVQRDEKTPHLSAFVVPRTPDGRLSAKEFIGNRDKMRADQTSFAELVQDLGLERGIPGSRATHQRVAQHYAQIAREVPLPTITEADLAPRAESVPGLVGKLLRQREVETPYGVAKRLNASVRAAAAPLAAKAATAAQERHRAEEMARTARDAQKQLSTLRKAFQALQKNSRTLIEMIARGGPELEQLHRDAVAKLDQRRAQAHRHGRRSDHSR